MSSEAAPRSWLSRSLLGRESTARVQLDSLDGVRGLAVLLVVFSHLSIYRMPIAPGVNLAGAGKYGVFLFFVLSAFLLTNGLLVRPPEQLRSAGTWRRYAVRRVLRIVPLYLVVLAVSYAGTHWLGSPAFIPLSSSELVDHLLLRAGKLVYWSIPVEFKYYLVLPIATLAISWGLKRRTLPVLVVGAAVVVLAGLVWFPGNAWPRTTVALWPYLPIFLLGTLAAFVHGLMREAAWLERRRVRIALEAVAWSCLALVLVLVPATWRALSGRPVSSQHFHREYLLFGSVWASFLLAELHGIGGLRRLLSTAPLRWVGAISFSVYLWHIPVLLWVRENVSIGPTSQAWLALGAVGVVSTLSYLAIERPFLRLGLRGLVAPRGLRRLSAG